MSEDKQQLRRLLRRSPVSGDSRAVCEQVLAFPWFRKARTVMAYAAIPPEPDLTAVLEAALAAGKRLLLPLCHEDGIMTARRIRSLKELTPGAYGIPEPSGDAEAVSPEEIELILTPGMAFSPKGARLGRGKGYYDRFLQGTKAKTVGICCESRLRDDIPVEPYDRCVDAVITDRRTILCEMEGDACLGKSAD